MQAFANEVISCRKLTLSSIFFALCFSSNLAFCEEGLTGNWGGVRTDWQNNGVDVALGLKLDVLRNQGGQQNATHFMWLGDAKLKLDANKLWQLSGTTVYFNLQSAHGGKMARDNSSYMGVDNLEVPVSTTKLFHAWVEKNTADEQFSVLTGLYPIDSEFYVTDSSGLFLHPSFGMSAEIAATSVGEVGSSRNGASGRAPSIFNTSSLGIRFKYQPTRAIYAQLAVNDGVPGDPNNAKGTHIRLDRGDGSFVIGELGLKPSLFGLAQTDEAASTTSKVALGAWRYNPKFNDWQDGSRKRSFGTYLLAEQSLTPKLSAFFRHGVARDEVSLFKSSSSLGLSFKGLLPGRENDQLGLASTRARASDTLRRAEDGLEAYEQVVEFTYRAQVKPWLAVQPNFQYITNPGLKAELKNAKLIGVRFEITL